MVQGHLVQGDNRTVLSSLRDSGTLVTCAYIDPPYNTHDRLGAYNDSKDDDVWLDELQRCALQIRDLLDSNGSLWVSIDDRMMHYLKVRLDAVFGRENFLSTIVWEHRTSRENRAAFSNNHEYILVYAKHRPTFKAFRNTLPVTAEWSSRFKNPDNDPKGAWQSVSVTAQGGHATASQYYLVECPDGRRLPPPKGRCWALTKERFSEAVADGRIYFGRGGKGVPRYKKYLSEVSTGLTPHTLWKADEVGTTAHAKKHLLNLNLGKNVFDTPKPEELLARIIQIASNKGDLVLDAFLGSGTTSAVAHKLGRRYVGIEIGDEIASQCALRLKSVIAGEQGGVSRSVIWSGGGHFEFLRSA